jgi:hypothetical protein
MRAQLANLNIGKRSFTLNVRSEKGAAVTCGATTQVMAGTTSMSGMPCEQSAGCRWFVGIGETEYDAISQRPVFPVSFL